MLELTHSIVDIAIVCSNFDESFRFYHEQLGLEIVLDLEIPESVAKGAGLAPRGFRQVRLEAGNTLIKLMQIESPPATPPNEFSAGVRWLTLFVADTQKLVETLEKRGVTFLAEPVSAPDAAGVVCTKDPDGLLIEFVQV